MSIGVIGLGIAGGAMYRGFQNAGRDVLGHDIDYSRSPDNLDDTLQQDVVLIAVPTPVDSVGECDLSAIDAVLDSASILGAPGSLVLRSTVPVGTTERLIKRYPALKIGFSPEFLRAGSADRDFLHPPMTLYGGHDAGPYFEAMKGVTDDAAPRIVMAPAEAELVKLLLNGFAALKTIFASELAGLARSAGADWGKVVEVALLEGRLGKGYLAALGGDGLPGFDGGCLPKDCRMLAGQLGAGNILERALEINARLRSQ